MIRRHPVLSMTASRGVREDAAPAGLIAWRELAGLVIGWDVLADSPALAARLASGGYAAGARGRLNIEFTGAGVAAWLSVGREGAGPARFDVVSALAPGSVYRSGADGEVLHIEAAGVLTAVVSLGSAGEPRVMYARTPLLLALGIGAGAVDRPTAAWGDGRERSEA